ncbi:GldG family protein [Anaerocolumna aminovalerica]|uniref:GldG family protein n=1 Tax=Anaerocolumna aminovalerica TaxID=1527 RepID=UPI000BE2D6B3|nr:GldG family protein [Anaerocolumna aminovalerica]
MKEFDNEIKQEQEMPKKETNKVKKAALSGIKASFSTRKFKGGAYTTVVTAVVLVIVLLINVFVSELDLKVDLSSDDMFTLTDTTKEYLSNIKDDITIYYMVQTGSEDNIVKRIMDKYNSASGRISVIHKDPVLYPAFASQYTDEEISNNSVIVVNNTNGKVKYVDYNDMFEYEMDYTTYNTITSGVDVEGQITSAIQYTTMEELPVMYMVEGHGEMQLSDTLKATLKKINVTTNKLATLKTESIPEDCSILLITAPQTDYSTEEVDMIKEYLSTGGDAIILVDYAVEGLGNFNSLLNYYGVGFVNGVVLEGNSNYHMGKYVNYLLPNIESHEITSSILTKDAPVITPVAKGIEILDSARSTIELTPLLTTSDSAYSKTDIQSDVIDKETGDIEGPFNLGILIEENYNDAETKIAVYGSAYMIDEDLTAFPSSGNMDMFLNTVNYVGGKDNSVAIPIRNLAQEYLTISASQSNFWAALVVIVIPASFLITGGYICIKRRKK